MSGIFGSSQWMYSSAAGFYDHEISQSLRFEDGDSAHLHFTPSSDGNKDNWTFSCWAKRTNVVSGSYFLFGVSIGTNQWFHIGFTNAGTLDMRQYNGSSYDFRKITTALYRDTSGWYHIVMSYESTNSTAEDRIKLYVNGERVTSFSTNTNPSSGKDAYPTQNHKHVIGAFSNNNGGSISSYFDGYMAETHFVDGTALDATSFGETKSGIWIPKAYSGSYGTNGFYLDFANSSSLGNDVSGNNNDFTSSGLAASDQVSDSPTNNFAAANPLTANSSCVLKQGNLEVAPADNRGIYSTFVMDSGKWYWESRRVSGNTNMGIIATEIHLPESVPNSSGQHAIFYYFDGRVQKNNSTVATVGSVSVGDIVGFTFDASNRQLKIYKNNSLQTTVTAQSGYTYSPGLGAGGSSAFSHLNFGQDSSFAGTETAQGNSDDNGNGDFYYSPPSGFLALCTANLPDPVIDPNQDDTPEDYFNTVTYTNQTAVTGVGFAPDFVWHKSRNQAYPHYLYDVIRGTGAKGLNSDSTAAEGANDGSGIVSFDSDGVTWSSDAGLSQTQGVGWFWKAGGAGVSNTDGTVTTTVSANTKAGFSILEYTGTGANLTAGHGLDEAPEMFIVKNKSSGSWFIYHTATGTDGGLQFGNGDKFVLSTFVNSTAPTSTVFSLGTYSGSNTSGANYIGYCFHSVDGYSKIGEYKGNGSADGTFVYTGFRPAFVLAKKYTASDDWVIHDNKRLDNGANSNPIDDYLRPNLSNTEGDDGASIDFLSNGFKWRINSGLRNQSGQSYIYIAFAEQPFKYANAR